MNPFVLNEFIKKYWMGSGNFFSHTVRPTQASRPGGSISTVKIARRYYEPPETNYDYPLFHYFQLGQLPPELFGIEDLEKDAWVRSDLIMKNNDVLIQIVVETGMTLTPRDIWLRKTRIDNNFIMAIFQNPNFNYGTVLPYLRREESDGLISTEDGYGIPISTGRYEQQSLDQIDLVIHFYSNADYFKGDVRKGFTAGKAMSYDVANPKNLTETMQFLNGFEDSLSIGWVNGNGFIYTLPAAKAVADEFTSKELGVYQDLTIKEKIFFKLSDALEYTREGQQIPNKLFRLNENQFINRDDIEVFVGVGDAETFKGVNVNVSEVETITPVFGYELSITTIELLMAKHKFIADDYQNAVVLFIVRQSGKPKTRQYSRFRLDLYDSFPTQLKDQLVTGKDFKFHPWSVEAFNESKASRLIYGKDFDRFEYAMLPYIGVSGLSNLVAKNPIHLTKELIGGKLHQSAMADWGYREELWYRQNQLYLEILPYSMDGRLLQTSYRPANFAGRLHFQNLPEAKCVETRLVKWYSKRPEFHRKIEADEYILTDDAKFFGWGCYISNDIQSGIWELAEEGKHYDKIDWDIPGKKRKLQWNKSYLESQSLVGRIVEGGKHVHLITYFDSHNQYKDFAEINILPDDDGNLGICPAYIDVWMDDLLLIEGVDYVVGKGKIFVFLIGRDKRSQIRLRMHGISPYGHHIPPLVVGWASGGQIVFGEDARKLADKQLQITIGGRVYHRDEVGFGDGDKITDDVMMGEPFMVKENRAVLENYFDGSTVEETLKDLVADKEAQDMAALCHPVENDSIFAKMDQSRLRKVISGLINTLVYNFLYTERFLKEEIKTNYTKAETDIWLADFLYLVDVDVTKQKVFNDQTMLVLPHREAFVSLSQLQVKFIQFVNETYLENKVTLSNYIIAI